MLRIFHIVVIFLFALGCSGPGNVVKRKTISMGTFFEIIVKGQDEAKANKAISEAFVEIERLNQKYSTYREDNLMWQINKTSAQNFKLDPETYKILQRCDAFYRITHGGFDPAIGGLIDLLGFEGDSAHLPSRSDIASALKQVGWEHIDLSEANYLRRNEKVKLNFGAVVKGYAVDNAAIILLANGIENFLINGGGEIFANGDFWTVGVQHPRKPDALLGELKINGKAVATSGDYNQYIKIKGKRFNHIINPVTGLPAHQCQSVTIIADDVMTADAIATGIFVLGRDEGMKIIKSIPGLDGMIIDSSGNQSASPGFLKYYKEF